MYLGCYTFTGDDADLQAGYEKMRATLGDDGIDLHICAVRPGALSVVDACPSHEVFKQFSQGEFFVQLCKASGLPTPTIVELGEVRTAIGSELR
jgi:hypothetical protein